MMEYDLELDKAVLEIKKNRAKLVCIQLPDGLKPYAKQIQEKIKKETSAEVVLWGGSCFGACDVPHGLEQIGTDMLIQFGHSRWPYKSMSL